MARRADGFMDLVAAAVSGDGGGGRAGGDDRYMVHIVKMVGGLGATQIDGEPITDPDMNTIACDCSTVEHVITEKGEPLHLGRRSRSWSTAQRRAVDLRDGGHCRFPGCSSRFVDIHHIRWWEHQGLTDIDHAMNCCRRHHTLIHRTGFKVDGDPNDELRFARPDASPIGSTFPALATRIRLPMAS